MSWPDLPKQLHRMGARLRIVDSPKVMTAPGKIVNLTAVAARTKAAAAEYYPPVYWLSMAQDAGQEANSRAPGTMATASSEIKSQPQFLREFKTDGSSIVTPSAPRRPAPSRPVGRLQVQRGSCCAGSSPGRPARHGRDHRAFGTFRGVKILSNWTTGSPPANCRDQAAAPARPGAHAVITVWEWSNPKAYLHDEVATDKRIPRSMPTGALWATENSHRFRAGLRPAQSVATRFKLRSVIPRPHRRPTT